jgi:hypothetical protein
LSGRASPYLRIETLALPAHDIPASVHILSRRPCSASYHLVLHLVVYHRVDEERASEERATRRASRRDGAHSPTSDGGTSRMRTCPARSCAAFARSNLVKLVRRPHWARQRIGARLAVPALMRPGASTHSTQCTAGAERPAAASASALRKPAGVAQHGGRSHAQAGRPGARGRAPMRLRRSCAARPRRRRRARARAGSGTSLYAAITRPSAGRSAFFARSTLEFAPFAAGMRAAFGARVRELVRVCSRVHRVRLDGRRRRVCRYPGAAPWA